MIVDTRVYNVRQVLAHGKSGVGLPIHKSEKTDYYCSVTAIFFFIFIFGETFQSKTSVLIHCIYVIAFCL